jgi:DNA topoisomerase-6 subunit B
MVVFVHMASVWVPFTSESKEAIADYDEIRKEITLALREAGRRLGVFLKRRSKAHDEYKRRNVFELYIEEVVGACKRLKGGRFAEERLRKQLTEMAKKLTGGEKTDALVDEKSSPHGLPHSIIVTAEGVEGDVPSDVPPPAEIAEVVHEAVAQDQQAEAKAEAVEDKPAKKTKAKKAKPVKKAKPKSKAKPVKKKGKR